MADTRSRVCLGTDDATFSAAIELAASSRSEIDLVGISRTAHALLHDVAALEPDVLVLDTDLPSLDSTWLLARFAARHIDTRVLFVAPEVEGADVHAAVGTGAGGFLLKGTEPHEVLEAAAAVARGHAVFAPAAQAALVTEIRRRLLGAQD